jgi:hypothetical protein
MSTKVIKKNLTKNMLLKLISAFVAISKGIRIYCIFCVAILVPLFFILGFAGFEAVLNHKTTLSLTFLVIAASIAVLDSFFIRKISLIKFERQLVSKLKTELSQLSLTAILTLIAMAAIICLSPYVKTDFAMIAVLLSLIPLSLLMFKLPSTLISLLTNKATPV